MVKKCNCGAEKRGSYYHEEGCPMKEVQSNVEKERDELKEVNDMCDIANLEMLWKEYVLCPSSKLTLDAIDTVRNPLLNFVKKREMELERQNKILTDAWESVIKNDKTPEYAYPHGGESIEAQQNNCGELPKGKGERWQTPREIAQQVLNDAKKALGDTNGKRCGSRPESF
jgi:hypothetical protein